VKLRQDRILESWTLSLMRKRKQARSIEKRSALEILRISLERW
jgi:hypothetical protein